MRWESGGVAGRPAEQKEKGVGTTDAAWPADVDFVEYVRARQHTLLRGAYLVCADLPAAEEMLEAALVRLAGTWHEVRDEQPDIEVRRLLYRAAVSWPDRDGRSLPDEAGAAGEAGETEEPEAAGDASQRRDVLHALHGLTPMQRAALVLRHLEDRTEGDVARILGVSVATVRRETDEAVTRLRAAVPRVDRETRWAR
jgi:RNA polymerase sigma factor (sigma-70 family)